jgi:hypothetical protein
LGGDQDSLVHAMVVGDSTRLGSAAWSSPMVIAQHTSVTMKIITLTEEQYDLLVESLSLVEDEGPIGEGWKSPELKALITHVEQAETTAHSAAGDP